MSKEDKIIKDLKERNESLNNQFRLRDIRVNVLEHREIEKDKEIERLNNIIKTKDEGIKAFTEDLCEENTKIEKAIEYIEKNTENIDRGQYYEDYVETYPVLQILKGVDK